MVGCGSVADLYLPVFKHLSEARLEALVDVRPNVARELAAKYGVGKVYGDVREAVRDPDIDALIIGTPPEAHAGQVEAAAAAGKHVLCEKPMAATVGDCRRIIDACRKHGVKLQMAHMKRFMRGNQRVKAIVDSGILGKVFLAECHWDCGVPGLIDSYRERKGTGGGSLQDHGPHCFDLVRWWTGNDILSVSATMRIVHPERSYEDMVVAVLEHENGMVSHHHMTRVSYGREHSQDLYRLYGTAGTLVVRNDHHFPTRSLESPEIILYAPGGISRRYEPGTGWNLDDTIMQNYPFYNETKAFCRSIASGEEPLVTGEDGMHAMEAVMAAYVSAVEGRKVDLPFRDEVDLEALFDVIRGRDRKSLGVGYTVETSARMLPSVDTPFFGFSPPRTKEKWEPGKHGSRAGVRLGEFSGRILPPQ